MIQDAAAALIAVADDSGTSLIDVISYMEHYIVNETKVDDGRNGCGPGRRGYTLLGGRLVEVSQTPLRALDTSARQQ